ncbi:hypothetical protein CFP56_023714 [Quercus suber]|uniref:Zinc knuckle CX2CX4HX4C domain-containing protein n=1 Tax=Quercus suber TaxID=58331 RepID=A0AAW0M0L3_QUESU
MVHIMFEIDLPRVGIDIAKPLRKGRKLALRDGQDNWVCFKYERMPNICHWCGKLTHMDRECPIRLKGKNTLKEAEQQFAPWMRAATPNLARKSVVRVAGFEENESETEDSGQENKPVQSWCKKLDTPFRVRLFQVQQRLDDHASAMEMISQRLDALDNNFKGLQALFEERLPAVQQQEGSAPQPENHPEAEGSVLLCAVVGRAVEGLYIQRGREAGKACTELVTSS